MPDRVISTVTAKKRDKGPTVREAEKNRTQRGQWTKEAQRKA